MANINDSAGIFVGPVLDMFNEVERLVARDADLATAQSEMLEALKKIASTKVVKSGTGQVYVHRAL